MTEFVIANMAPLMFASMVLFLLFGFPVAFALAANGILFGLVGIELGLLHGALFQALPERIFGIMANDTLLAVPFFTFMGLILERSGMAEDLLDTIGQLFGPLRGGLAIRRDLGGCAAGGHHRRGGGLGDFHGPHLAADHAALRLRPARRQRRDRRIGNPRADHSAITGAHHHGRPARSFSVGDMYAGCASARAWCSPCFYLSYIVALVTLLRPAHAPALPPGGAHASANPMDPVGVTLAGACCSVISVVAGSLPVRHYQIYRAEAPRDVRCWWYRRSVGDRRRLYVAAMMNRRLPASACCRALPCASPSSC
jgi:hypothetical protein